MITIFYDQQCILCRRYKQALDFIDHTAFNWLDANDDESIKIIDRTKDELLSEIHILLEDSTVLSGSEAMSYILAKMPGASRFAWLMEKDSTKKAIETFHSTSEKLRRRLIKSCPSCKNRSSST